MSSGRKRIISMWIQFWYRFDLNEEKNPVNIYLCVCARGKQFFSVLKRKATITTARTFIHVSKQQKTIEVTLNNAWFWFGRSCVRKCVCVCVCLHTVALSKKCWISVSSISGHLCAHNNIILIPRYLLFLPISTLSLCLSWSRACRSANKFLCRCLLVIGGRVCACMFV